MRSLTSIATIDDKMMIDSVYICRVCLSECIANLHYRTNNDFTLTFQNHESCIFIALLLEFSEQLGPQNKDLFASLMFNISNS